MRCKYFSLLSKHDLKNLNEKRIVTLFFSLETPFGNLDQTFSYFKDLLLCHAVNVSDKCVQIYERVVLHVCINVLFLRFRYSVLSNINQFFQRPPHSIELFTPDEIRKITEYTVNTYFRHFKMYKYAFTPLVSPIVSLITYSIICFCIFIV